MKKNRAVCRDFVCPSCFYQLGQCTCGIYPPLVLIHIDEGIQECVRKLNEKGYETTGCCESHYEEGASREVHVCMAEDFPEMRDLPDGAKYRTGKHCVYFPNEGKTEEEFERIKAENLKMLLSWIENLPERWTAHVHRQRYDPRQDYKRNGNGFYAESNKDHTDRPYAEE